MPAKGHRTVEEIEAWLAHQGYGLEHETAEAFRRLGFVASQGRTHLDPTTQKVREIDVVAEVVLTRSPAHIYAVIECKAGAIGAWVIRKSLLPWNEDLWIPISTDGLAAPLHEQRALIAHILPVDPPSNPIAFSIVEAVTNGDRDAAYGALSQATSAARGWLQRAATPSIALPVVVVDTPLFTLTYDATGKPQLAEVDRARVLWTEPGQGLRTAVDVVRRSAVLEHAKDLRFRFQWLADKLIEHGLPEAVSSTEV